MDERYWDHVAGDYDGEIFDSLASDRHGVLLERLDEFADRSLRAADAGCGVGKYVGALAARFARVDAYDLSADLLAQARRTVPASARVRFFKRDFAARSPRVEPVDFALCANVLIMASDDARRAILRSVRRLVLPGGHALFLVPSVESALLVHHRLAEWNFADGFADDAAHRESATPAGKAGRALLRGHLPIDRVPTKHFLREELEIFLRKFDFEPLRFDKVEYRWETEFAEPPAWMQAPFPWDWLVSARRE